VSGLAEALAWLTLGVALAAATAGCASLEKLATPGNAQGLRQATRRVCADLAEADRIAGAALDGADAGTDR
jgi:hypothetical protein